MAVNERLKKQNVVEVAEEFFTLAKGRNVETSVRNRRAQRPPLTIVVNKPRQRGRRKPLKFKQR